eukprot:gb/GECG01001020.1/.p1 GENE.gb/GECG01001020.1/~~gb/GECG01001020.1/.p1  ORF type:complete len:447 (+),score=63.93 gb/GECG01001020.1/:1-1341(+)
MSHAAFRVNTSPLVVNSGRERKESQSSRRRQPLQHTPETNTNCDNVVASVPDEHDRKGQGRDTEPSRKSERQQDSALNGKVEEERENLFGSGELNNTREILQHLDAVDRELNTIFADCEKYERKSSVASDEQTGQRASRANEDPTQNVLNFGFNSVAEQLGASAQKSGNKNHRSRRTTTQGIPERPSVRDILQGPDRHGKLAPSLCISYDCTESQSSKLRSTLTKISKAVDHAKAFHRQLPFLLTEISIDSGKHLKMLNRLWCRTAMCFKHRLNCLSDLRECESEEQRRQIILQEYSLATEKLEMHHRLCDSSLDRERIKKQIWELKLRSNSPSSVNHFNIRLKSRSKDGIELDCSSVLRGLVLDKEMDEDVEIPGSDDLFRQFKECSSQLKSIDKKMMSESRQHFEEMKNHMMYGVKYTDIMEAEAEVKNLLIEANASKKVKRLF